MPIKITANPGLFAKWRDQGDRLHHRVQVLSGIVQNDLEVSPEDLKEWVGALDSLRTEIETTLKELGTETANYIINSQPK